MAQNWIPETDEFPQRYVNAVQAILNDVDQLGLLNAEFVNDTYGGGAPTR